MISSYVDRPVLVAGDAGLYDLLVALHVVCAVVGFGAVAISGSYGAAARHLDRPGAAEETQRYFRSRGWAELLIAAVPFLGMGALAAEPAKGELGDVWVLAGLGLWVMAATLLFAVVRPSERRIRTGQEAEAVAGGRQLMWAAAGCDVFFVLALAFMIAQPR